MSIQIPPPATLGLLGGGELGRFFVMAAHDLGYQVVVLDPDRDSPAGRIADEHLVADYKDPIALGGMVSVCAAVTTVLECVPADTLAYLALSVRVAPSAEAVAICQNRRTAKSFLRHHNFLHVPYADIHCEENIADADADLFPAIMTVARCGGERRQPAQTSNQTEALAAFRQFGFEPCVLEKTLTLDHEFAVVLARDATGKIKCFPAVENRHQHGFHEVSSVPAARTCQSANAMKLAEQIATRLDYVGVMTVEFFVVRGLLYVNKILPRPHNAGHYTLDCCISNQFEQQVRALCGLPLGDVRCCSAAAMVNLTGDLWFPDSHGSAHEPDWQKLLAVPNLKLHLYGKRHAKPGRKMGHFTVLGDDPTETLRTAMAARTSIGIGIRND